MEMVRLEDICFRDHVGEYGIAAAGVDYTPQTHRYLRITDISDDGRLLDADIKGVQGDIKDKYFLKTGDIVFARTGNSTGRAYTYDERDGELVYAGFLIRYRLDPAKVNPKYLHYFTHSNYYKTWVDNLSSGSTRGNISAQTFADCPILLPSRERQDQLVSVLSALDRKIALNRRKIATLEKMAKEIYDYWFVQYDFPDANGRPYKSSGGEMVYSPELKREIPKGWKSCSINDCGRFYRGVSYNRADERIEGDGTVLVMRGNNISDGHIIDDSNRVYVERSLVSVEQYLNKFEVLFAMSSGSKEHVGKAAVGYDYPRGAAFGAFCSKFVPEDKCRYVVYSFLASAVYRSFIKQVCAGTGINNLKSEHFDVPLLAFPLETSLLDRFNAVCSPIYESIFAATQETERMESLREFTLPLLMNGQVRIGGAACRSLIERLII